MSLPLNRVHSMCFYKPVLFFASMILWSTPTLWYYEATPKGTKLLTKLSLEMRDEDNSVKFKKKVKYLPWIVLTYMNTFVYITDEYGIISLSYEINNS